MIKTTVQYTIKINYTSDHLPNVADTERRKDNLENSLEHCRQANMIGTLDDDVNWVEVINQRTTNEEVFDETKEY
jgi:hypothetical protein